MQYSVSEVKNTASKMLRFGMPNVLPLEITFLFRNHKLGSFSSSLFKFIPPFFNGVFLMVNYIIAKHHKKVNKIL